MRTCTRPTWMPLVLSLSGTTARTRSPVLKPLTCFWRRRYPRGKPVLLQFVRQCSPRPVAVIATERNAPGAVALAVLADEHTQHVDHVHVAVEVIGLSEADALARVIDARRAQVREIDA